MSASKIEWTEQTWNPIVGCSLESPGCTNCYAMKLAGRLALMGTAAHYEGTTQKTKAGFVWTGKINVAPDSIFLAPLKRRKPTTYFVNSMSDMFHADVPDGRDLRCATVAAGAAVHWPAYVRRYRLGGCRG